MNYRILNKAQLIELLKEKDKIIETFQDKTKVRAELIADARDKKEEIKELRVEKIKKEIKSLVFKEKRQFSITEITEMLNLNRKTFYNLKLNEFLKEIFKSNFDKYKAMNHCQINITKFSSKTKERYEVSVRKDSSYFFLTPNIYSFQTRKEFDNFLEEFKKENPFKIIEVIEVVKGKK